MNNVNLIREYREHAGLTQEHLGNKVGVSRQTIAAWEKNASELSVLQLAKLAKALGIALDLLLAFPSKEEKENQLMFRADAPEYLTASLQRLLTKKAADYALVEEWAGEIPVLPEFRPLFEYNAYQIEEVARETRNWLGVGGYSPLTNVLTLLEEKGLKVILHSLPDKVSGFSAYTEVWGGVIFINDTHPIERQFFTVLHELGHLIFHRPDYRKACGIQPKKAPREQIVNHFAAAVLLSEEILKRELYAYRDCRLPEPLLRDIKRRYYVSLRTILIRAATLNLISEKQKKEQLQVLNQKYGKEREPVVLEKPQALTRLERMIYRLLIEEKITTLRAAEILGENLLDIRENLANWMEGVPA